MAFDALAAVVSSPLGLRYEDLSFVSWLMYAGAGFFARRHVRSLWGAAKTAGLVGLADATAGWAISSAIDPDLYAYADELALGLIALVMLLVVASAVMLGAIGGLLAQRLSAGG
ncbi:MAG: hypothetical protein M3355_11065 [Actinomycetota bacterium]|nr:hypothetical protein [Actinomycetota bacterium]